MALQPSAAGGERRWHGESPRIQPTLGKLIRVALSFQGVQSSHEAIRGHQAARFGCADGGSVIAELMPLPSRSTTEWIYRDIGDVAALCNRETYVAEFQAKRVALLRSALRSAAPRAVVFIGLSALAAWAEVAGVSFTEGPAGARWASVGQTRYVVVQHPTAFGAKNEYFEAVGRALAA